jgi:hypothetical protein
MAKQIVTYRPNHGGQSYWFSFVGTEQDARAEFERINTITPKQAPWLRAPASRGYHVVSIVAVR